MGAVCMLKHTSMKQNNQIKNSKYSVTCKTLFKIKRKRFSLGAASSPSNLAFGWNNCLKCGWQYISPSLDW